VRQLSALICRPASDANTILKRIFNGSFVVDYGRQVLWVNSDSHFCSSCSWANRCQYFCQIFNHWAETRKPTLALVWQQLLLWW